MLIRNSLLVTASIIALAGAVQSSSAQESEITVYTTTAPEALDAYAARFNETHPEIKVNWIRDSTGVIAAKVLAEGANSTVDAIHVLGVSEIIGLDAAGMLLPYKPQDFDA